MTISHINFMSIPVADQDRALAFYRDQLGFEVSVDVPYQDDWRWIFMALPGGQTRLNFVREGDLAWKDGMPALVLVSNDVDAETARLRDAGVTIHHGPEDSPWAPGARFVMIKDSEGNIILMESGSSV